MSNPNKDSVDLAKDEALRQRKGGQAKQMILWFAALIVGAILGWMQVSALNELFNFVATVFTRLFQFIAVPTSALGARCQEGHGPHLRARRHLHAADDDFRSCHRPRPLPLDCAGQPAG